MSDNPLYTFGENKTDIADLNGININAFNYVISATDLKEMGYNGSYFVCSDNKNNTWGSILETDFKYKDKIVPFIDIKKEPIPRCTNKQNFTINTTNLDINNSNKDGFRLTNPIERPDEDNYDDANNLFDVTIVYKDNSTHVSYSHAIAGTTGIIKSFVSHPHILLAVQAPGGRGGNQGQGSSAIYGGGGGGSGAFCMLGVDLSTTSVIITESIADTGEKWVDILLTDITTNQATSTKIQLFGGGFGADGTSTHIGIGGSGGIGKIKDTKSQSIRKPIYNQSFGSAYIYALIPGENGGDGYVSNFMTTDFIPGSEINEPINVINLFGKDINIKPTGELQQLEEYIGCGGAPSVVSYSHEEDDDNGYGFGGIGRGNISYKDDEGSRQTLYRNVGYGGAIGVWLWYARITND